MLRPVRRKVPLATSSMCQWVGFHQMTARRVPRSSTPARAKFPFSRFYFPIFLMRGGFGRRMHPMLWNFVDAARRRLLIETEKLIQRTGALAGLI
jgi:hypothetical protein